MELNETTVKELHSKIDAEAREQINLYTAQVKESARKKHEALDELWVMVQGLADSTPSVTGQPQERPSFSLTSPNGAGRKVFPTQEAILNIIADFRVGEKITQPMIFNLLLEKHSEVKERNLDVLKGQIPAILNNLVKKGVLEAPFKEAGGKKNIYKKKKQ